MCLESFFLQSSRTAPTARSEIMATSDDRADHEPTSPHSPSQEDKPLMPESESENGSTSHLTVAQKSKVNAKLKEQIEESQAPSKALPIIKWVAMIVLGLVVLLCVAASKISLVNLGENFRAARNRSIHPSGDTVDINDPTESSECIMLMLIIVICLPYEANLLRALWCGGFRSDRLWPSPLAAFACVMSALMEAAGLALFVIEVLTETSSFIGVLLMNGVFIIPNCIHIYDTIMACRQGGISKRKKFSLVLFVIALLLQFGGVLATILSIIKDPQQPTFAIGQKWAIPLSILLLSIAWCPKVQIAQLYPCEESVKKLRQTRRAFVYNNSDCLTVSNVHGVSTESEEPLSLMSNIPEYDEDDITVLIRLFPELNARYKSTIIAMFVKIIAFPGFCFLYGHFMGIIHVEKLHDALFEINMSNDLIAPFLTSIVSSLFGYVLGWMACMMCMQPLAFALPMCLATPVSLLLIILLRSCNDYYIFPSPGDCEDFGYNLKNTLPAAICLYVAQILCTSFFIFKTETIVMQKESELFWLPGYNSVFLEQHLMLHRKNVHTDRSLARATARASKTHVLICTTMYREAAHEMEQLLSSIKRINLAKQQSGRNFQSHIFFDNGICGSRPTDFALQLISIAKKTLGISMERGTKVQTPYGAQLLWRLPTLDGSDTNGMMFCIHLKDNQKVKNKKRWSQIMYMSYLLDFYMVENNVEEKDAYILATDADVKFSPESVEALMDLMTRDNSVGAVCARTYPMGSGPMYWYQVFDYAIGHWLQKVSNHVLGSVLCCPGCFSVYRAEALRDTLPTYASLVEKGSEFLTKDMGEDRWLCTLMVQSGWRLDYCAASDNSTYCPEEFDEYFKQRRRWIPSTLANQLLLLQEWQTVRYFNKQISFLFMVYQALLLISTLINPSVCILIIVGGLQYAWPSLPMEFSLVCMLLIVFFYTLVCLYAKPNTQLQVAKALTVLFIFIMAAVSIGVMKQIVDEQGNHNADHRNITTIRPVPTIPTTMPTTTTLKLLKGIDDTGDIQQPADPQPTSTPGMGPKITLPMSISTMYLTALSGMFIITALLHFSEAYCLFYGIFYLFTLPAGNLVLIIYSICNITDRSWGTREEKKVDALLEDRDFKDIICNVFNRCLINCRLRDPDPETEGLNVQDPEEGTSSNGEDADRSDVEPKEKKSRTLIKRTKRNTKIARLTSFRFHGDGLDSGSKTTLDWLPRNLRDEYGDLFLSNGYTDTSFIAGMTNNDLIALGIKSKAQRSALMDAIKQLPPLEIDPSVPDNVDDWLDAIGLAMYKLNFKHSNIVTCRNMEILKTMTPQEIESELGINKQGHLRRLLLAITKLRYPTETEREKSNIKTEVDAMQPHQLEQVNQAEADFWEKLRQKCLLPDSVAFAHDVDLKAQLTELRNSTIAMFVIVNVVWLILICTLATKSALNVFDTNVLGLCFLFIFGIILVVQFICMIIHRLSTCMHLLARSPLRWGGSFNQTWSFGDIVSSGAGEDEVDNTDDVEAQQTRDRCNREARGRYYQSVARRRGQTRPALGEASHLIGGGGVSQPAATVANGTYGAAKLSTPNNVSTVTEIF